MKKHFKIISVVGLVIFLNFSIFMFNALAAETDSATATTESTGYSLVSEEPCSLSDAKSAASSNAKCSSIGLVPCGPADMGFYYECDVCGMVKLVDNIIDFISVNIAPYLALLMIVAGAVTMMMSGGSETVYKKGKEIITMALIGLLLVWGSWIIIDVIMSGLGKGLTAPWYSIDCEQTKN